MRAKIFVWALMPLCVICSSHEDNNNNPSSNNLTIVSSDVIEDVGNVVKELSSVTSAAFDKLGFLKMLASKKNREYIGLLGPVGSLLSTALTIGTKEESPEYQAIRQLDLTMRKEFASTRHAVDTIVPKLSEFVLLNDYSKLVSYRIANMKRALDIALNQELEFESRHKRFMEGCKGESSNPFLALSYLSMIIDIRCPIPTLQETKTFVNVSTLLDKIQNEQKLNDSELSEFKEKRQAIIDQIKDSTSFDLETTLSHLQNAIGQNRSQADHSLWLALRGDEKPTFPCLLNRIHEANEFERDPLLWIADVIRLDLIEIETYSYLCTSVENVKAPSMMKNDIDYIESTTGSLLYKLGNWIEGKLSLSWDDVTHLRTKREVGVETITSENFNKTAERIRTIVNKLGPENYQHTVIVMENWKYDEWWRAETLGSHCLVVENEAGINIFITRHDISSSLRLQSAREWLEKETPFILQLYWELDYKKSLIEILSVMNYKLGDKGIRNEFGSVVVMKNMKVIDSLCTIEYGITTNVYLNGEATTIVLQYHADHPLGYSFHITTFFNL